VEILPLFGEDHLTRLARDRRPSALATIGSYARRLEQLISKTPVDLTWLQYEFFPYLPPSIEQFAVSDSTPLMIDYDDAIFHMYDDHRLRLVRHILGRKLEPLMRRASVITCGNAYIQSHASRFCRDTPIIPTVVDTDLYMPADAKETQRLVGWIGSPSTWSYVEPLLPTLLPLLRRHGWRLRVIGAGPRAERIDGVDASPWSEMTEIAEIQRMDIGIMPIPDTVWTRGKCGFKLVQYMACGLPVVASPVGVNRDIVSSDAGLLASTEDEWIRGLDKLIGDPDLRRCMGEAGRARIVKRYSLASQQKPLLEAFQLAVGKPL
jgi:glycosyltransferase involved in cell wall biosynthesis